MTKPRFLPLAFLAFPIIVSPLCGDAIQLKSHEKLYGELIDTQAGFILLKLPETEGEAIRRISPQTIDAISFSDSDAPLEQQALKRSKFIPLLSESDATLLVRYLQFLQSAKQNLAALNYTKLWHPKNNYPSLDPLYRNLLIETSLAAKLPSEALIHAQNWLAQKPQPFEHPLPWQIQAQHQLDTGQAQAALWTVLTPIAYATHQNRNSLEPLHKLAAQAYQQLGYPKHAQAHLSQSPIKTPSVALILDPAQPAVPE